MSAPGLLPDDAHDRALLAAVHPPGWTNPPPAGRYHLVVIGGGTAGLVTAAGAAGLGARVALVERHLLGGDCLNYGCVPSKAVIRSSRVAAELRGSAAFGVHAREVEVDFGKVMERMRGLRAALAPHDSAARFSKELGVDVFLGGARFVSEDAVEVAGARLRFRRAVIATGARAGAPDVPGLAEAGYLTNETVFSLTERPQRLAVVGGGPIGCELAQALQRLGCAVTLIHDRPQLLEREDPDVAAVVQRALERDGVRLLLGVRLARVSRAGDERRLEVETTQGPLAIPADAVLVATGRLPNVEGLGLEAAGVAYDARGVRVDDRLRTTNPRVLAAGDVCMGWKFTHAADFAARIAIRNALFFGRQKLSSLVMPWCTYTDPEVAHVGHSERTARAAGIEIETFLRPLADVDRARLDGDEDGLVKVHVRRGSDRIVGATIVARHAGESIGELAAAIQAGIGLGALARVIHPYPTQAEAIRQLGDAYQRTRLTPLAKRAFRTFFSLWR